MHDVFLSLITHGELHVLFKIKGSPSTLKYALSLNESVRIHKSLETKEFDDAIKGTIPSTVDIIPDSVIILYDLYFFDGSGISFHYIHGDRTFGYESDCYYPPGPYSSTGEYCKIATSKYESPSVSYFFKKLFLVDVEFVSSAVMGLSLKHPFMLSSEVIDLVKDKDTPFYRYLILLYKVANGIKYSFKSEKNVLGVINTLLMTDFDYTSLCSGYEVHSAILAGESIISKFFTVHRYGPYLHLVDTREGSLPPADFTINPFYTVPNE